mgnify:FL=1
MLERGKMDRDLVEFVVIDQLVPKEHLLRKIDAAVDFTQLYEMVEPLYCEDNGHPSIDPVVLFKMESFFATLKKEKIYQIAAYKLPREQVKTIIFRYVFIYYNRVRNYTRNPLGLPPAKYREWAQAQTAT